MVRSRSRRTSCSRVRVTSTSSLAVRPFTSRRWPLAARQRLSRKPAATSMARCPRRSGSSGRGRGVCGGQSASVMAAWVHRPRPPGLGRRGQGIDGAGAEQQVASRGGRHGVERRGRRSECPQFLGGPAVELAARQPGRAGVGRAGSRGARPGRRPPARGRGRPSRPGAGSGRRGSGRRPAGAGGGR